MAAAPARGRRSYPVRIDFKARRSSEMKSKNIAGKLGRFNTPNGWEGPNELLVTVGRRPH
jgi:hypothetical protein